MKNVEGISSKGISIYVHLTEKREYFLYNKLTTLVKGKQINFKIEATKPPINVGYKLRLW